MIKLASHHALVVDRDGRKHSFDFDAVLLDLVRCFQACGVRDSWPADNIALIVEEHMEQRRQAGEPPVKEADLDTLVSSVLTASGFSDVAAEYGKLRQLEQSVVSPPVTPWDSARLARLISRSLPLSGHACIDATARVRAALDVLGLDGASDELIRQLAIHLLPVSCAPDPVEKAQPPWSMNPDTWRFELSPTLRRLLHSGSVKLFPVSQALPRVRAELNLVCVAEAIGDSPLTELVLLPGLRSTVKSLRELLRAVRSDVVERWPHAAHHPAHLIVRGLGVVLHQYVLPLRASDSRELVEEIHALFRREFAADIGFEQLVTFR